MRGVAQAAWGAACSLPLAREREVPSPSTPLACPRILFLPAHPHLPPTLCPLPAPACLLRRAGIKKPAQQRYRNTKGVDPKFLRNQRYVTRGIRKVTDKAGGAQ